MMRRRNRRIRTGVIRARAIDNRHIYTTTVLVRSEAGAITFGSLDTYPDRVAVTVW